jgi:nitrogen regulatory protein P-II 1
MREIKAFFRAHKAEGITDALDNLGVTDYTVTFVMGIGEHLADTTDSSYSIEVVKKYSNIAKLELVCKSERVVEITRVLREVAYTGTKGDGIIYVTPVEKAIKIRTGAIDSEALK